MTAQSDRPHIGIVGSGPAGFYTAQQILKVSSSKVTSCLSARLIVFSARHCESQKTVNIRKYIP